MSITADRIQNTTRRVKILPEVLPNRKDIVPPRTRGLYRAAPEGQRVGALSLIRSGILQPLQGAFVAPELLRRSTNRDPALLDARRELLRGMKSGLYDLRPDDGERSLEPVELVRVMGLPDDEAASLGKVLDEAILDEDGDFAIRLSESWSAMLGSNLGTVKLAKEVSGTAEDDELSMNGVTLNGVEVPTIKNRYLDAMVMAIIIERFNSLVPEDDVRVLEAADLIWAAMLPDGVTPALEERIEKATVSADGKLVLRLKNDLDVGDLDIEGGADDVRFGKEVDVDIEPDELLLDGFERGGVKVLRLTRKRDDDGNLGIEARGKKFILPAMTRFFPLQGEDAVRESVWGADPE